MMDDDKKNKKQREKPLISLDDLVPKENVSGGRKRPKTVFGLKRKGRI